MRPLCPVDPFRNCSEPSTASSCEQSATTLSCVCVILSEADLTHFPPSLVTSLCATLFPVCTVRVPSLRRAIPATVFEITKFFGSGVILATGFIHLLEPATDALGEGNTIDAGGCLPNGWAGYPYAFGICLSSLFAVFVFQLVLFRLGTERLATMGITDNPAAPSCVAEALALPAPSQQHIQQEEPLVAATAPAQATTDLEKGDAEMSLASSHSSVFNDAQEQTPAAAAILGVVVLELGVMLHSVIIGLTLAVQEESGFVPLFVVVVFHQMFEGLGLGTRLAFLRLPDKLKPAPFVGGVAYSACTPIGMAIGLGLRNGLVSPLLC